MDSLSRSDVDGRMVSEVFNAVATMRLLIASFPDNDGQGCPSTNTFEFVGRENDTNSYYYRARYYDPTTGRFNQEDPAGELGGLNLYAYAAANPLRFTDPTGLAYCGFRKFWPLVSGNSGHLVILI